jgi:mono/diheme cytochrome c family protein
MKNCPAKTWAGSAFLVAVMLGGGCCSAAAQGSIPGPFAQDQVDSGRKGFAENCAECHGKTLAGESAPALAGKAFVSRWESKTTADLYKFIQTTMPMCHGGLLGNTAYAEIVAFLLWANGAQPGKDDFDGKAQAGISAIVTGTVRSDLSKSQ